MTRSHLSATMFLLAAFLHMTPYFELPVWQYFRNLHDSKTLQPITCLTPLHAILPYGLHGKVY